MRLLPRNEWLFSDQSAPDGMVAVAASVTETNVARWALMPRELFEEGEVDRGMKASRSVQRMINDREPVCLS